MTYVSRDPFAREELHRETIKPRLLEGYYGVAPSCAWCGGTNARGNVYRYRTETDGGRVSEDAKAFCSISCRRSFYS